MRLAALAATVLLLPLAFAAEPDPDPLRAEQWYLTDIRWNVACPFGCGNGSVKVAIIDTGYDLAHEDLAGRFTNGWNALNGTTWVWEPDYPREKAGVPVSLSGAGHGTQVAGVLGGITENNVGIAGMAHVTFIPITAMTNSAAEGIDGNKIADAIDWAVAQQADVISMSFHVTHNWTRVNASLDAAYAAGVVLVGAAGNNNPLPGGGGSPNPCEWERTGLPASHPGVIAVAGTDHDGFVSALSWWGPEVDVAAPMVDVTTTQAYDNRYTRAFGTSFATPMVAATAALILTERPALTPAEVKSLIVDAPVADIPRDPGHNCVGSPTFGQPTMGFPKLDVKASLDRMAALYP